jgi:NAD(P)H-hydrate repair Nnr-like enzyme with NAD(P)H-hydrate dehydratase domain
VDGAAVERLDDRAVASLLPEREARSHKGRNGRLTLVAGSLAYAGAGILAARAAARAGAGLVRLAVPGSLQPLFAGRVPEVITLGLPESSPGEVDPEAAARTVLAPEHSALAIGSGRARGRTRWSPRCSAARAEATRTTAEATRTTAEATTTTASARPRSSTRRR